MKSLFLMSLALAAGFAVAQAEPGELAIDAPSEGEISMENDVSTLLAHYLSQKGWAEGVNIKADGSSFIIQTGTGVIAAPKEHPSYNESRSRAFEKAMLEAKGKLSEALEVTIATAAGFQYAEKEPASDATAEEQMAQTLAAMPDESVCGKVVNLIHKKLDNALAKEGYDASQAKADYSAAKAKMDRLVASSSFQRNIAAASTSMISGLQAFYTIESQGASGNGEIGVVAIWSPALAEMAASLTNGQPVANKAPKKPIIQQISSDPKVLLSTFGVQQKINERGELVLVSFAQSAAKTNSAQSKKAATSKARLIAQAQIRNFAGEAIQTCSALEEAEVSEEFADSSTPNYKDESAYLTFQKTAAAAMVCNGINTFKTWNAIHPITKKPVFGVICTWSPQAADIARKTKAAKVEASARDGAAGRRSVPGTAAAPAGAPVQRPAPKVDPGASLLNSGAEGDDDAF